MIPDDGEEKRHIRLVRLICALSTTLCETTRSIEAWLVGFLMLLLRPLERAGDFGWIEDR